MTERFVPQEGRALYGLLSDLAGDIVVKTNRAGFIETASPGFEQLGVHLDELLISPHLADLTDAVHAPSVRAYLQQTLAQSSRIDWLEFPVRDAEGEALWYSLTLSPMATQDGEVEGALGVLRCVQQARALEARLFENAMTDPQTGLVNRQAFIGMTERLMRAGQSGANVLFEIDQLRAIRLRFGQEAGDEVIEAFAQFLRGMLGDSHILARFEENRLAVLLTEVSREDALALVGDTIAAFKDIAGETVIGDLQLSASASVTMLDNSLQDALIRGEVALTVARSAGGFRVESGDELRQSWRPKMTA